MNRLAKIASRIIVILSVALAGPLAANAQELTPDHLALAREYVNLTDKSQVFEVALIETGIATMRTIISQNPEITEEVSAAIGSVIEGYSSEKDKLFDQFARVYALRFTETELTEIVNFYRTDTGKKLAEENSAANRELSTVMRVYQNNLNTEFFAKVRAELRAKDINI